MNDVSKSFGSSGAAPVANPLAHPLSEQIIKECTDLLSEKSAEGRRLVEFARANGVQIHVITGREPNYVTVERGATTLICPAVTKAVDLDEMACNLGMGLRECEIGFSGLPLVTINLPQDQKDWANYRKTLDALVTMCKIVHELSVANNSTKLIDLVRRLGHYGLYEGVLSGKSDEELGKILINAVNETRTKG